MTAMIRLHELHMEQVNAQLKEREVGFYGEHFYNGKLERIIFVNESVLR